jgi:hypothetical protein
MWGSVIRAPIRSLALIPVSCDIAFSASSMHERDTGALYCDSSASATWSSSPATS